MTAQPPAKKVGTTILNVKSRSVYQNVSGTIVTLVFFLLASLGIDPCRYKVEYQHQIRTLLPHNNENLNQRHKGELI